MTVSFVGSQTAEAETVTIPPHQAGDMILMTGMLHSQYAMPAIPPDWIVLGNRAFGGTRVVFAAYKKAASSSEVSGTWTGVDLLSAVVYRDDLNYLSCNYAGQASLANTARFRISQLVSRSGLSAGPPVQMRQASGVVVGVVIAQQNSPTIDVDPSGMTRRSVIAGATDGQLAVFDTSTPVASWATTNVTTPGNVDTLSMTLEIIDTAISKAGGGGAENPVVTLLQPSAIPGV